MKRITIFILLILGFSATVLALPVNECKIDIYYGNGVWNKQFSRDNCIKDDAAECSQKKLNQLIYRDIIKNNPALQAKYGKVKLAYNWSADKNWDLAETFFQLREAGQLGQWTYYQLLDALETRTLSDATGEDIKSMRKKLIDAIKGVEQSNVDVMLKKYHNESFRYSHRVLLVSHSQGNLFANRVYDSIDPSGYQAYFANVQVASPANRVHASHGTYITGSFDPVINTIPGSMESNADIDGLGGHAFVAAYLDSSDTYTKIKKAIKAQLKILDTIGSQWDTDQIFDQDTCDYRITVKHRFDSALEIGEKVYPFNAAQKLYQVNGEYVKASCGGSDFTNEWRGKKENECWMIDNPQKETIATEDNDSGGDTNTTDPDPGDNNTTDPTQDPNKVCVSNIFSGGSITEELKRGDKDTKYSDGDKTQVQELQQFLEALGYSVGNSHADGWFGKDTESALIDFQAANDLDANGIVGPQTREAMNNTNCYDKP